MANPFQDLSKTKSKLTLNKIQKLTVWDLNDVREAMFASRDVWEDSSGFSNIHPTTRKIPKAHFSWSAWVNAGIDLTWKAKETLLLTN